MSGGSQLDRAERDLGEGRTTVLEAVERRRGRSWAKWSGTLDPTVEEGSEPRAPATSTMPPLSSVREPRHVLRRWAAALSLEEGREEQPVLVVQESGMVGRDVAADQEGAA